MKSEDDSFLVESYEKLRQYIKKQRYHFVNKGPCSQGYGLSISHVWMWELDHKEGWGQNWCFQTVVPEKTLENPLDNKEIKPVNPKGYQPWILIGRTDAEAEGPILWPPDSNSWLTRKGPNAGKEGGQEEKEATEDEIVGWLHRFNEHELGQTPGDGEGWGGLVCCSSWDLRVGHDLATEQQQWNRKRLTDIENRLMVAKRQLGGEGRIGSLGLANAN